MSLETKERIDPSGEELFKCIEPVFDSIFVSTKRLSSSERAVYQQCLYDSICYSGYNFVETLQVLFKKRIKEGFQYILEKLKQKRHEDEFNLIVEKEINHLKYGREYIVTLFWSYDKAFKNGATLTFEIMFDRQWEKFIRTVNETFQLNL